MSSAKADQSIPQRAAADAGTTLAIERTEYALERTQLAWIRTTLGFLGSGIALDKGMEIIHKSRVEAGNALFENAHAIGISLSILGTIIISLSSWFCFKRLRNLGKLRGNKPSAFPMVLWLSSLIALLGIIISVLLIVT